MNGFKIRNAAERDIDTLYRWGQENWQLWGSTRWKWYSRKSLKSVIAQPRNSVYLVAESGGKLAGMCFVENLLTWSFCVGLFVDATYRGKGIGKMLLDRGSKEMKNRGAGSIMLLVDTKNPKAKKFYLREGYTGDLRFLLLDKEL